MKNLIIILTLLTLSACSTPKKVEMNPRAVKVEKIKKITPKRTPCKTSIMK